MFIVRESQAMDYPAFSTGCDAMYPKQITDNFVKFIAQMHPNGVYIKVLLMVLAFSNTCSIISFSSSMTVSRAANSILIFNIQNVFVTVFWKYLLYQHGFAGAVQCLSDLSKYIVNLMQNVSEQQSEQHKEMIHTVIEDTTRLLINEQKITLSRSQKHIN